MRRLLSRLWTDDELSSLREMLNGKQPVYRIAHKLHRSQAAVRGKMHSLGLNTWPDALSL
jgi:hypothetical protein